MEMNFSTIIIVFLGMISTALGIKCYDGSTDAVKQLNFTNCSKVHDACAKLTTQKGSKMFCAPSDLADQIEEDCISPKNQRCYCQKDGCNEFKQETTTMKPTTQTTKQIVNAETTKQGNSNSDMDTKTRSGITTPSSNLAVSHNEVHVLNMAGIITMVGTLLLTN